MTTQPTRLEVRANMNKAQIDALIARLRHQKADGRLPSRDEDEAADALEITERMRDEADFAMQNHVGDAYTESEDFDGWYQPIWSAMLAASPSDPQPSTTAVLLDDETLWDHKGNVRHDAVDRLGERQRAARAASPQLVEKAAEYRDFNEFWSLNWGDFPRTEEADARRIWEVATGWKNGGSHD